MVPDDGILRWLDRQARSGPLVGRGGDLPDLPGPLSDALGEEDEARLRPRENPIEVEGPPLSEKEYRNAVRRFTMSMRDRVLAMSMGLGETALAGLARKVRRIRQKALSGDLFGGFLRQNPPLPGARTEATRDYTAAQQNASHQEAPPQNASRENPERAEMSKRAFRRLVDGVFSHLKDELLARTEALTATERGYVVEKLKSTRAAFDPVRQNPGGSAPENGSSENGSVEGGSLEDAQPEKPWWVDEGPEDPDRFASRNKAEQRGVLLGCGEEFHEREEGGETFYMPCSDHEEWKKKTGRDNPAANFHEAKVSPTGGEAFETYRREDSPEGFGRGIQVLYGIRPEGEEGPQGGRTKLVSLFYPAGAWNAANARRHAEGRFKVRAFQEAERENPASPGARTVELRVGYDLEAGGRSLSRVLRWASDAARSLGGELLWTDKHGGGAGAGDPSRVTIGMEVFGVGDAATLQHRWHAFTSGDPPEARSVHTISVGRAQEIAGDPDLIAVLDLQYDTDEIPRVVPADPPREDRFYTDARRMVKDSLGGWPMGVTRSGRPRTARFGFSTMREAIQAEAILKDATEQYGSARVYLSGIAEESSTDESTIDESTAVDPVDSEEIYTDEMHRLNPAPSRAGGASRLVRVTQRTEDRGQFGLDPQIRRLTQQAARAFGGEVVGTKQAPGGTVRDRYVEFESAGAAETFTRELNTTLYARGLSGRAIAVQEEPSRLAARENPFRGNSSAQGGAVLRVGIHSGALPEGAPDILSVVEEAAEAEGGEISGVRQSEGGSVKDYLVTAPATEDARSIISDLNNRFSTLGIAEAATATLQHKARENKSRANPPAEIRVGINQDKLPGDAPDVLSIIEEVAEPKDGEVSGAEQSGGGSIRDYTITAPTTGEAQSITAALNNEFSTRGIAPAATVTLQHEARQNEPRENEARESKSRQNPPAEVRVGVNEDTLPEGGPDMLALIERVAEAEGGEISGAEQSGGGSIRDYTITAETTSEARSIISDLNNRFSTLGIAEAATATLQHEARQNEARENEARQNEAQGSAGGATVMVRYPGGQPGLDKAVEGAATGAGGTLRSVGSATGSKYSGMKEAEVRFNSQAGAFDGVGQIESALRSEGIGEFEALTIAGEDVPPVRPNPLFPGAGQSLLSLQDEPPEGEPPEDDPSSTALRSEAPDPGSGASALTVESREAPTGVVPAARRLGEKRGEDDGLPDFGGEEEAFRYAVQMLPGTEAMEGIDVSTPEGIAALEEAASAWTNGYAEATGTGWPRLNPHAEAPEPDSASPDSPGPDAPGAAEEGASSRDPGPTPPRKNPEGKQGRREALSYLGLTAALLGGGVFLADTVLMERGRNAPATAQVTD